MTDKVGAAAILKCKGKPNCTLCLHLGTMEQHMVYKAELVGMIMGLYLIKTKKKNTKCTLSINNQAALIAIKSEMNKLGQHLADNLLQLAKQLINGRGSKQFRLTFRWSARACRNCQK